jgi:6-pyruvoyltetrahydropterin/6-carboxytetrahydropterin synthase
MASHLVTKTIDFCYGHRLLDYDGKCKHLHGHNGLLEVEVEASQLDSQGMVVDFGEVRDVVKGWVDANLDHKMLLCIRDPALSALRELGEPVYVMEQNPTAEQIAQLIYRQIREHGMNVSQVRLWETPTSCATYREG